MFILSLLKTFIFVILFIYFVCLVSGSLLLHGFFSSRSEMWQLSSCGALASHCSGFSCGAWLLGSWALLVVAPRALEHRFNSCGVPV